MSNFITENYIKDNSPVTDNVDPKDLSSHITAAEHNFLRPILGSQFYDELVAKFSNQTLSPDEILLMERYIQPAVLWRTIALALPWIQYNLRNKGLMVNTDDAAAAADFAQVKFMLNEAGGRANINEDLLVKFLTKNSNEFPEYKDQDGLTPPEGEEPNSSNLLFY